MRSGNSKRFSHYWPLVWGGFLHQWPLIRGFEGSSLSAVEQTIELSVIWDKIALICHPCNVITVYIFGIMIYPKVNSIGALWGTQSQKATIACDNGITLIMKSATDGSKGYHSSLSSKASGTLMKTPDASTLYVLIFNTEYNFSTFKWHISSKS